MPGLDKTNPKKQRERAPVCVAGRGGEIADRTKYKRPGWHAMAWFGCVSLGGEADSGGSSTRDTTVDGRGGKVFMPYSIVHLHSKRSTSFACAMAHRLALALSSTFSSRFTRLVLW